MAMTDTVLVLSKDAPRARDLKTILEFVGEESVLALTKQIQEANPLEFPP